MPVVPMFLPFAGTSASETISFTVPENIVLGSERAHISFLGEFLDDFWEVVFSPARHISSGATVSSLANKVMKGNMYSKLQYCLPEQYPISPLQVALDGCIISPSQGKDSQVPYHCSYSLWASHEQRYTEISLSRLSGESVRSELFYM